MFLFLNMEASTVHSRHPDFFFIFFSFFQMAFIRPLVARRHARISCSSFLPSSHNAISSTQLGVSFRREKSLKMTDWYHKIYHELQPNPLPPSPPPPPPPHNTIDLHSPFPHCDDNRGSPNIEDLLHHDTSSSPPSSPPPPFGLVLLNCPFGGLFSDGRLWDSAGVRVCADGAANRLFDYFCDCPEEREDYIPDVIIGDMDSLRSEVAEFYKERGVPCLKIYDDTTTDLEKSVLYLSALRLGLNPPILSSPSSPIKNIENVVVYGVFWGRFDHQISAINTLHRYAFLPPPPTSPSPPPPTQPPPFPAPPPSPTPPSPFLFPQINLISEGNYGRLLPPGRHFIRVSHYFQPLGTVCGILPVGGIGGEGGPRVRTRGLEWDLEGEVVGMGWGGVVSSSNQVVGEEVVVDVEGGSVFWWTGLMGGGCD